ncbi:hypothetical protein BJX99DRAFT_238588 [Aspergillus californicus]
MRFFLFLLSFVAFIGQTQTQVLPDASSLPSLFSSSASSLNPSSLSSLLPSSLPSFPSRPLDTPSPSSFPSVSPSLASSFSSLVPSSRLITSTPPVSHSPSPSFSPAPSSSASSISALVPSSRLISLSSSAPSSPASSSPTSTISPSVSSLPLIPASSSISASPSSLLSRTLFPLITQSSASSSLPSASPSSQTLFPDPTPSPSPSSSAIISSSSSLIPSSSQAPSLSSPSPLPVSSSPSPPSRFPPQSSTPPLPCTILSAVTHSFSCHINNDIAYDCGRGSTAGGIGTFDDPLTFSATPAAFQRCETIYDPYLHKYLRFEDYCPECNNDWLHQQILHIDVWMGSDSSSGGDEQDCQGRLTPSARTQSLIKNPGMNLVVDSTPLYVPRGDGPSICNLGHVYASYDPKSYC